MTITLFYHLINMQNTFIISIQKVIKIKEKSNILIIVSLLLLLDYRKIKKSFMFFILKY